MPSTRRRRLVQQQRDLDRRQARSNPGAPTIVNI